VAAAANPAFAAELYVKTFLAELQINVPQTHDLGKLYAAIPDSVRDEIEKSYATYRKNWYGRRASITIAKGPANEPKWDDYRSQAHDLGALLNRSGDVFSSWRYIYEFTEPDQGNYQFHQFEYGLLLSACDAMRVTLKKLLRNSSAYPVQQFPKCHGLRKAIACTTSMYTGAMPVSKSIRRSVTLPAQVAKQVESIAKRRRLSENRVLVELIEEGIEARKQKEKAFFELAERLRASKDPDEIKRLGDQMGRFVFGE
jgi:hypothetical protein